MKKKKGNIPPSSTIVQKMEARERESEKGKGNGFHFISSSRLHQGRKCDKRDKKAPYKKAFQFLLAL
jgi:hypothetical protein